MYIFMYIVNSGVGESYSGLTVGDNIQVDADTIDAK